ncbi:SAF domain-containing protein [Corynebacterium comes]|uniref:SAF domain-containing protein n=1 Tax=Corynebacterium comes TaxID=2675218 RepID=A0A6B8VIW5_9CORY|nr:SAF domain-containing protein [Corynebacterium comes]QGU04043.1 hypothetical protein CETAM_03845 [Corynebacterium comes]
MTQFHRRFIHVLATPGWRRTVLIRRVLAIMLLLTAVLLAFRQAGATDPQAVVFARRVAAGETLSGDDVIVVPVPGHLLPVSALTDPSEVEGLVIVAAAEEGEVATSHRFIGQDLAAAFLGDITTFIPLRPAEPEIIPLLHHGDTISIVTHHGDAAQPQVIASGGRVVLVDTREAPGTLLIGLPEEAARAVAAASLTAPLAVVLTPGQEDPP